LPRFKTMIYPHGPNLVGGPGKKTGSAWEKETKSRAKKKPEKKERRSQRREKRDSTTQNEGARFRQGGPGVLVKRNTKGVGKNSKKNTEGSNGVEGTCGKRNQYFRSKQTIQWGEERPRKNGGAHQVINRGSGRARGRPGKPNRGTIALRASTVGILQCRGKSVRVGERLTRRTDRAGVQKGKQQKSSRRKLSHR